MSPILFVVIAYVLGATPTSFWVGRAVFGVDLREEGSRNLGATNMFRVIGWKAALPVALADIAKGWVPVALLPLWDGTDVWAWTLAYAGAAVVGHVFSFWVRFKGGKGVATSTGVLLALSPWSVLVGFAMFVAVVTVTRIVSLGSILAAISIPITVAVLPHEGGVLLQGFTLGLALFVIWAHRTNIQRLLKGEENRFGQQATSQAESMESAQATGGTVSARPAEGGSP